MGKAKKSTVKENRRHSAEFKIEIAERMLAGENVAALSEQHSLPRSMMYRWRDAYGKEGAAGLQRPVGRPPGGLARTPRRGESTEEKLRRRNAQLERMLGQKTVEVEFLRAVFKRVSELPKAHGRGDDASIPKSDG